MTNTRHAIWILLASVGCATPMNAMREDNHRLTQSVAELRADRRAQDRKLRDLEHQIAQLKDGGQAVVPQLPVEVVRPPGVTVVDGQRIVGVADDGGEIIYEGDAATGKAATLDDEPVARRSPAPRASSYGDGPTVAATDHLEVNHHLPVTTAARATRSHVRVDRDVVPTGDAAAGDYRAAVELLKSGKHEDAVAALRAFLQKYPRHDYADNAQYWLGESFYAEKDYQHALVEFRATIETYPRGNKVPDALLKVGYCYASLGQGEKARAVLEQVVNLYPRTEPAVLAAKRLETP